jgi:hypothetical protein
LFFNGVQESFAVSDVQLRIYCFDLGFRMLINLLFRSKIFPLKVSPPTGERDLEENAGFILIFC